MRPKTPALLWDIRRATSLVIEQTSGMTAEDIAADVWFRGSVERYLEIAGEAARRLADYDEKTASQLPTLRAAISMRNVIAHQYDRINWVRVREMIDGPLTELSVSVSDLLDRLEIPDSANA